MKQRIITLSIICLMCFLSCGYVKASDDIPDFGKKGDISIEMKDGAKVINSGSFTIFRIGELENNNYVLSKEFEDSGYSLENMDNESLLYEMKKYAEEKGISGVTASVDSGQVQFSDLQPGIYLITQSLAARGYYAASPFLITLPYLKDGVWSYHVDAHPKIEPVPKPGRAPVPTPGKEPVPTPGKEPVPTPGKEPVPTSGKEPQTIVNSSRLPQTGQYNWPVPVLAIAGILMCAWGWYLYNTGEK